MKALIKYLVIDRADPEDDWPDTFELADYPNSYKESVPVAVIPLSEDGLNSIFRG